MARRARTGCPSTTLIASKAPSPTRAWSSARSTGSSGATIRPSTHITIGPETLRCPVCGARSGGSDSSGHKRILIVDRVPSQRPAAWPACPVIQYPVFSGRWKPRLAPREMRGLTWRNHPHRRTVRGRDRPRVRRRRCRLRRVGRPLVRGAPRPDSGVDAGAGREAWWRDVGRARRAGARHAGGRGHGHHDRRRDGGARAAPTRPVRSSRRSSPCSCSTSERATRWSSGDDVVTVTTRRARPVAAGRGDRDRDRRRGRSPRARRR